MTMRGPCEQCGYDRGEALTRAHVNDLWDKMLCSLCLGLLRASGWIPPTEGAPPPESGRRCARCGGVHTLSVRTVTAGGSDVEVALCLPCRRAAERENERALARRAGEDHR